MCRSGARVDLEGVAVLDDRRAGLLLCLNRPGMAGLYTILVIVAIALLAPMLANDRPIVASVKGDVKFPDMDDGWRAKVIETHDEFDVIECVRG